MKIKSESINEVYETAKAKFEKLGFRVNYVPKPYEKPVYEDVMINLDRFEERVTGIGESGKYSEGQPLNDYDSTVLENEVGVFFNSLRYQLHNRIHGKDPLGVLMCTADYLYAIAMKQIGCPDIPASFGPTIKKNITSLATTARSKKMLDQNDFYEQNAYLKQRYKDALEVESEITDELKAVNDGKATPAQVQTLIGAYKALQKRQNDHGAIWRLFHGTENNDRNALLKNMENALKSFLGENVDLSKSALNLAESIIAKNTAEDVNNAFADGGMSERLGVSEEMFVKTDDTQKISESETKELQNSLNQDLNANHKEEIIEPAPATIQSPNKTNVI